VFLCFGGRAHRMQTHSDCFSADARGLSVLDDDVPVDGAWIEMLVEGVLRRRVVVGHPEFVHKRIAGNLI